MQSFEPTLLIKSMFGLLFLFNACTLNLATQISFDRRINGFPMTNSSLRLHLSFLLWIFVSCHAFCQTSMEKVKFSRIEVNSGLSNSNITCFLQDSKGFLWVGTRDGLNKYDGYEFKVYRNDQEDSTSLVKNNIYFLFEDSHKQIWVSTRGGGLHIYDSKLDRFKRIKEFSSYCVHRIV
jgi:ligand-binding sensor domain-containing protein